MYVLLCTETVKLYKIERSRRSKKLTAANNFYIEIVFILLFDNGWQK